MVRRAGTGDFDVDAVEAAGGDGGRVGAEEALGVGVSEDVAGTGTAENPMPEEVGAVPAGATPAHAARNTSAATLPSRVTAPPGASERRAPIKISTAG